MSTMDHAQDKTLVAENFDDSGGNPAGGYVHGLGINIEWQNGPLNVDGVRRDQSGAFVEDLLRAVIQRLEYYNEGKFRCRENSLAITHCQEALHWMNARTADRLVRNVEGTHTV